jgi:hypothetical protein
MELHEIVGVLLLAGIGDQQQRQTGDDREEASQKGPQT